MAKNEYYLALVGQLFFKLIMAVVCDIGLVCVNWTKLELTPCTCVLLSVTFSTIYADQLEPLLAYWATHPLNYTAEQLTLNCKSTTKFTLAFSLVEKDFAVHRTYKIINDLGQVDHCLISGMYLLLHISYALT